MPAGLVLPISGPYVGSFLALPIGVLNDDGYELMATLTGQELAETDAFGLTLVEAIYRGQNWRARLRGVEWFQLGLLTLLQQFGQTDVAGTLSPQLSAIGTRWTTFNGTLLLTAILGNPPSQPQSLTALSTGFAPNSQSAFNMTSKVREMPLELVLFPYSFGGFNIPFSSV